MSLLLNISASDFGQVIDIALLIKRAAKESGGRIIPSGRFDTPTSRTLLVEFNGTGEEVFPHMLTDALRANRYNHLFTTAIGPDSINIFPQVN